VTGYRCGGLPGFPGYHRLRNALPGCIRVDKISEFLFTLLPQVLPVWRAGNPAGFAAQQLNPGGLAVEDFLYNSIAALFHLQVHEAGVEQRVSSTGIIDVFFYNRYPYQHIPGSQEFLEGKMGKLDVAAALPVQQPRIPVRFP